MADLGLLPQRCHRSTITKRTHPRLIVCRNQITNLIDSQRRENVGVLGVVHAMTVPAVPHT